MLRNPQEAEELVTRLTVSGRYSELAARKVIAAALGHASWPVALEALRKPGLSYPLDWRGTSCTRFYDAHEPFKIDPLPFDAVFAEPPRTSLDELRGLDVRDAVALVAKRHDPYGAFATDFEVPCAANGPRRVTRRIAQDDLVTSFEVTRDETEPDSRMAVFTWRLVARRSREIVAAAQGDAYAPLKGAQLLADEAIDVADEVSDRDVSNIRAIFAAGLEILEHGILTIDDLWVSPEHRGRTLSHDLLVLTCREMKSYRKIFASLAMDPWEAPDALVFPNGFESPQSSAFSLRHLCRALYERRYLRPLQERLSTLGFDLIRARTSARLGFHQVLSLIGEIVSGGDPLGEVESEESAAEKFRAAGDYLNHLLGDPGLP